MYAVRGIFSWSQQVSLLHRNTVILEDLTLCLQKQLLENQVCPCSCGAVQGARSGTQL